MRILIWKLRKLYLNKTFIGFHANNIGIIYLDCKYPSFQSLCLSKAKPSPDSGWCSIHQGVFIQVLELSLVI